jgi:hypothetical protein
MKRKTFFAILCFVITTACVFGAPTESSTRRFGIFIGSNNGGRERVRLRYAVSDANSVSKVFYEMGGIADEDSVLLIEPSIRDINRRIDALHEQVRRAKGTNKRTEIIFYYSGHSDEEGLLLNREKYPYRELRDKINSIPSDMRIVILDSCASGAFTRLKGGEKTRPFLMDSSLTAEGYAFLTSSSADESSQESDRIEASYFTHSLVAGLRGAADSVGDGRVTLNELYRFAYSETMARTETSVYGTQHPSYDIQISGSGDLVLTDVKETSAGIVFDEKLTGRLSIRNSQDHLIAEITKTAVRQLELGLEPGDYRITLQQGRDLLRAEITLVEGRRVLVKRENFAFIDGSPSRRRGSETGDSLETDFEEETDSSSEKNVYTFFFNSVNEPFYFPLIGFINLHHGTHRFPQVGFVNTNTGDFSSVQVGFVNIVKKEMIGAQVGFVNIAGSKIKGTQFGFINYAESIEYGVPVGFISIVKNGGYHAVEYSFSEVFAINAGLKLGVDKFYTSLYVSYNPGESAWESVAFGIGAGSIIPIGKYFFINPEMISLFQTRMIINGKSMQVGGPSYLSMIPSFGIKLGKHFSISAGPSVTWVNVQDAQAINIELEKTNTGSMKISVIDAALPNKNFGFYSHDINDFNRIVVGARASLRLLF